MQAATTDTVPMIAERSFLNAQHEGSVTRGRPFRTTYRRARVLEQRGLARPAPQAPATLPERTVTPRARPLRLGLLTPVWQRIDLTRRVLAYYAGLSRSLTPDGFDVLHLVVGSEGQASQRLADAAGCLYVEAPNRPLSMKFQAGLSALRAHDVDGVVLVGSDDLLNRHAFDAIGRSLDQSSPVTDFRSLYVYDQPQDRLAYVARIYIGAGRTFSRAYLDGLEWRLWTTAVDKGVDMQVDRDLQNRGAFRQAHVVKEEGAAVLDIKTETNIWSLDRLLQLNPAIRRHGPQWIDPAAFFDMYFPEFER